MFPGKLSALRSWIPTTSSRAAGGGHSRMDDHSRPVQAPPKWEQLLPWGMIGKEHLLNVPVRFSGPGNPKQQCTISYAALRAQARNLNRKGDEVLRTFIAALKKDAEAGQIGFQVKGYSWEFSVKFEIDALPYEANCRLDKSGRVSRIAIATGHNPPSRLDLDLGQSHGDTQYFPPAPARSRSSERTVRGQITANDPGPSAAENDPFVQLRIPPDDPENAFVAVCSVLKAGTREQLKVLRNLIKDGAIDVRTDEGEPSPLSELVEFLAQPRRQAAHWYAGPVTVDPPSDQDRLDVLKGVDPSIGKCSDGRTPIEFADYWKLSGLTEALLKNAPEPDDPTLRARLRHTTIRSALPRELWHTPTWPFVLYEHLGEYGASVGADFAKASDAVRKRDYKKAAAKFERTAAGINVPDRARTVVILASYANLIRLYRDKKARMEPNKKSAALLRFALKAQEFVADIRPLPLADPRRSLLATIFNEILAHWDHFSVKDKKVVIDQMLPAMKRNYSFALDVGASFREVVLEPLLLDREDAVVTPLLQAEMQEAAAIARSDDLDEPGGDARPDGLWTRSLVRAVAMNDWKKTQDDAALAKLLHRIERRRPNPDTLIECFDLFSHAKTNAAKDRIAALFNRDTVRFWSARAERAYDGKFEFLTLQLQQHASASMGVHYLQSVYRKDVIDEADVASYLKSGQLLLNRLTSDLISSVEAVLGEDFHLPDSKFAGYSESDRRLIVAIALEDISLTAQLGNLPPVPRQAGSGADTAIEAIRARGRRNWLSVKDWIERMQLAGNGKSAECQMLRNQVAEHVASVAARFGNQ